MKRVLNILFSLFLLQTGSIAQPACSTFTLNGTINADSGKMRLLPIGDTFYYPKSHGELESVVRNGRFSFTGPIEYPTAYMIGLKWGGHFKYLSGIFFVDPCTQEISCNIDSVRLTPGIDNASMKELRNSNINSLSNKELIQYVNTHPSSYIALWQLIKKVSYSYEPDYDSAYVKFADPIKGTYAGKILAAKLAEARVLAIGSPFPHLHLLTENNEAVVVPQINKLTKYVVIDFWFSHCPACISEFPAYKSIYAKYKNKGLEIISISTDSEKFIKDWKNIIKEQKLAWVHVLDKGAKKSSELSILEFPTNFLLDSKGIIIKTDFSTDELEKFLIAQGL